VTRWWAAVVLVLALGGCASAPVGPPDPFPARPADIDLNRLDPCATVSPESLRAAGVDPDRRRVAAPVVGGKPTRLCDWGGYGSDFGFTVQFFPSDAEQAVGADGAMTGEIEGYGTVRFTERETIAPFCEILVDTGESQLIRTQTQAADVEPPGPGSWIDKTCDRAVRLTAEVIRSARGLAA
jgi:hypothetical protein